MLPAGLKTLSYGALSQAQFGSLSVDPANEYFKMIDGCLIDKSEKALIYATDNAVIPENAGIETIGYGAFMRSNIREVHIPEGVKYIDGFAFFRCWSLYTVTLPSTLEYVDDTAFRWSSVREVINNTDFELHCGDEEFGGVAINAFVVSNANGVVDRVEEEDDWWIRFDR